MHSEPSTNPSSRRRPISELVSARAIRIRARAAQHHFLRRLLFSGKIARVFRTSAIFVAVGDNPPGSALSRSIERAVAVEGRRHGGCRSGGCGETRLTASVVQRSLPVPSPFSLSNKAAEPASNADKTWAAQKIWLVEGGEEELVREKKGNKTTNKSA
jgi:hypothetical protein